MLPHKPDKKELLLQLLETAWVLVHLDPRREGVDLPDHLRQQKHLILQYGYNMPKPIADLKIDDRGISATLSFRLVPHATFIPWSAIFAMSDGDKRNLLWQEDLPADLSLKEEPEPEPAPAPAGKPGKKPRPSHLKLVD